MLWSNGPVGILKLVPLLNEFNRCCLLAFFKPLPYPTKYRPRPVHSTIVLCRAPVHNSPQTETNNSVPSPPPTPVLRRHRGRRPSTDESVDSYEAVDVVWELTLSENELPGPLHVHVLRNAGRFLCDIRPDRLFDCWETFGVDDAKVLRVHRVEQSGRWIGSVNLNGDIIPKIVLSNDTRPVVLRCHPCQPSGNTLVPDRGAKRFQLLKLVHC